MEIKGLGPFTASTAVGSERDEAEQLVRSETGFVRAIPPQEELSDATEDQTRQGLLRLADYLRRFNGKRKKAGKKASKKVAHPLRSRALRSYQKSALLETEASRPGHHFHLKV